MKPVYYLYLAAVFLIIYVIIRLRKNLITGWRMRRIDKATGEEFEQYLYYKFQQMGYRVRHTGKSGDYGADLILYSKKPKEKIVVQAKRYKQKVGQEAVREAVAATAFYHADRAIVVTNSTFTDYAKNLAEKNHVLLYDREWLYKAVQKKIRAMPETECTHESEGELIYCRKIFCNKGSVSTDLLAQELDEYLADQGYEILPLKQNKIGREENDYGKGKSSKYAEAAQKN